MEARRGRGRERRELIELLESDRPPGVHGPLARGLSRWADGMSDEELARIRKQVVYAVVDTEGPAHDRRFTCAALIDGEQRGVGTGSTKKEAEQRSAEEAFLILSNRAADLKHPEASEE